MVFIMSFPGATYCIYLRVKRGSAFERPAFAPVLSSTPTADSTDESVRTSVGAQPLVIHDVSDVRGVHNTMVKQFWDNMTTAV